MKFKSKHKTFYSGKCIWKYRLRDDGHFVQGELSLYAFVIVRYIMRGILDTCVSSVTPCLLTQIGDLSTRSIAVPSVAKGHARYCGTKCGWISISVAANRGWRFYPKLKNINMNWFKVLNSCWSGCVKFIGMTLTPNSGEPTDRSSLLWRQRWRHLPTWRNHAFILVERGTSMTQYTSDLYRAIKQKKSDALHTMCHHPSVWGHLHR